MVYVSTKEQCLFSVMVIDLDKIHEKPRKLIKEHLIKKRKQGLSNKELTDNAWENYSTRLIQLGFPEDEMTKIIKEVLKIKNTYRFNDQDDAQYIKDKIDPQILWDCTRKKFWFYDDKKWCLDNGLFIENEIVQLFENRFLQSKNENEKKHLANIFKDHKRFKRIIEALKIKIWFDPDEFNANQYYVNFQNGTLDLETDTLLAHNPDNYQTKIVSCDYDPRAKHSDMWEKFLLDIFLNDIDLIEQVQTMLGAGIVGRPDRRQFSIWYGSGANGKSCLMEIFRCLMGDYCINMGASDLMATRGDRKNYNIVNLKDRRMLFASESEESERLHISLIKMATSSEPITAEQKFMQPISFQPLFASIMATNNKPIIRETSNAIWSRVRLIPFEHEIEEKDRVPNYHNVLLESGRSGIFNWIYDGFLKYKVSNYKIKDCQKVLDSTYEYQLDEDPIQEFIDVYCVIKEYCTVFFKDIYDSYEIWVGKRPMSKKRFSSQLIKKGFIKNRNHGGIYFNGIGLLENNENSVHDYSENIDQSYTEPKESTFEQNNPF